MRPRKVALAGVGLLVIAGVPLLELSWVYRHDLREEPGWYDAELGIGDLAHFEIFNLAIFPPDDIQREVEAYTERPDLFPRERIDTQVASHDPWRSFFDIKTKLLPERGPALLVYHPVSEQHRSKIYEVDGLLMEAGDTGYWYSYLRVLNAPPAATKTEQVQWVADRVFEPGEPSHLEHRWTLADRAYGTRSYRNKRDPMGRSFIYWMSDGRTVGFFGQSTFSQMAGPPAHMRGEVKNVERVFLPRGAELAGEREAPRDREKLVQRLDVLTDPQGWALHEQQNAISGFVPLTSRTIEDPLAFDKVDAYHLGFDRWATHPDAAVSSIDATCAVVADDGTLCPSIVWPGTPVAVDVGQKLLDLFDQAPVRSMPGCQTVYRHAFVYRKQGKPVRVIRFSPSPGRCPHWESIPGGGREIGTDQRAQVIDICVQAGLSFCGRQPDLEMTVFADWQRENDVAIGEHWPLIRRNPRPPRVAMDKKLSELTKDERRRLCVWNQEHTTRVPGADSFEVKAEGTRLIVAELVPLTWAECVERFPSTCDKTIEEAMRCMTAAHLDGPSFSDPENAACRDDLECVWGFAPKPEDAADLE